MMPKPTADAKPHSRTGSRGGIKQAPVVLEAASERIWKGQKDIRRLDGRGKIRMRGVGIEKSLLMGIFGVATWTDG